MSIFSRMPNTAGLVARHVLLPKSVPKVFVSATSVRFRRRPCALAAVSTFKATAKTAGRVEKPALHSSYAKVPAVSVLQGWRLAQKAAVSRFKATVRTAALARPFARKDRFALEASVSARVQR